MGTDDDISRIRALLMQLSKARQDYDFQPPSLVSHVADYAGDPARLQRYARQTINGRIMVLLSASRMTTQRLLETYVAGLDSFNPLPLLLAARAQLELYVVIADTLLVITENSGDHETGFIDRVGRVDRALINATYGTRSTFLKELMPRMELSRLRPVNDQELELLTAKNILTRLARITPADTSIDWKAAYERLCEYVHPNWGMNMLLVVPSPVSPTLLRFSNTSRDPFHRALAASCSPMARAAERTISAFDHIKPPFGSGEISYPGGGL